MSDTPRGCKKLRGCPINQNSKIGQGEAAHNPIDRKERNPDLNQNKTDVGLVYPKKRFDEVQLKNECTNIFCFDSVENLLHNANRLSDLTTFQEAEVFRSNARIQKGF